MATILIVDDNKKNLQILGNVLHEKTYRVAMAIDGPSAIKLATKLIPDLIVLDIMMPGMDGFEVCEILKSQVNTNKIPIIFLSAKIDLEDIVRGFKIGGADYITKPFKKEELLVRIQTQIEITEGRKKIEQQAKELEALNKLKDEFCDVVTYEIKKALENFTAIPKLISNSQTNLTHQNIDEIISKLLNKNENTYQLLENILWWSQSQRNLIQPKIAPVNLLKALEQIKERLLPNALPKQLSIELNIDKTTTVFADEELLQMVLKNIVFNAIMFSNSSIICNSVKTDKNTIIQIIDKGIGMNNEELISIQKKLDSSKEQGSGIGLTVSKELLLLMNASINIDSEKGKGTTVELIFQNKAQE